MSSETAIGRCYAGERNWGDSSTCRLGLPSHVAVDRAGRLHVLRRDVSLVAIIAPDGSFAFNYGEGDIFEGHGIFLSRFPARRLK